MNGLPLRLRHYLLAVVVISFALSSTGHSQPSPADSMDSAFARMMAEPGNADAALDYARIAAARGDTRAAIAALERFLRANPALDNIRLELASLYLAAGSPDVAAVYAREALSSPNIPPDVAVRAQELLASAEKRAALSTDRQPFSRPALGQQRHSGDRCCDGFRIQPRFGRRRHDTHPCQGPVELERGIQRSAVAPL
jgi:tetratricopeptide (TPR) repeat protein